MEMQLVDRLSCMPKALE